MTAWRNVIFSGLVGACLFAGCTVTTSDGTSDGGGLETGGTSGTGGSTGVTGGSANTGGTTGPATTVLQCKTDYVAPADPRCGDDELACDACLQKNNCTAAYEACYWDDVCMGLVSAMMACMVFEYEENNQTDPIVASETCQKKVAIAIWQPVSDSEAKAKALWTEGEESLDCTEVCCAVVTDH